MAVKFDDLPDSAFIRSGELRATILPVHRATLHRWVQEKKFPAPVELSPRMIVWRVGDVRAWLKSHQGPQT